MNKPPNDMILGLKNEKYTLKEQVKYWSDPRIIGLQNISGSKMSAKEIVAALKTRIKEIERRIPSI
jgi:hypothetical protein